MSGIRSAGGVALTVVVHGALLMVLLTGLRVKPVTPPSRDIGVRLIAEAPAPRQAIRAAAAPRLALPAIEPLRVTHAAVLVAAAAEAVAPEVQARPAAAMAVAAVAASTLPATPEPPAPAEAVVTAADHQHCPQPDYPSLLRSKRIEGQVLLRVRVEADGRPSEVVVRQGSGWRLLDEAARQSARRCLFRPARRGQAQFASWVEYPVSFALSS
ncbi:MAG: energy transducer TonB [Burkholderiaceae bacterium]|nr:energy transducer TonB [Burkholderiaceae bacterium]